jgi:hypothetical protein
VGRTTGPKPNASSRGGGEEVARRGKSSSGKARSAITGRYVKLSTAKKNPKTTVIEKK